MENGLYIYFWLDEAPLTTGNKEEVMRGRGSNINSPSNLYTALHRTRRLTYFIQHAEP